MHPISKLRIESYVSSIQKLKKGVRVISAESIPIESMSDENILSIREALESRKNDDPVGVYGIVRFFVVAINEAKSYARCVAYGMEDYDTELETAAFYNKATVESGKLENEEKKVIFLC
jgi:hypothetical protein